MGEFININSNFFSALLGALVGGLFSLWATNKSHKHQLKIMNKQEEEELIAFLNAIHSELSVLHERYAKPLSETILKDEPGMKRTYTVHPDVFNVYNANLDKIGLVEVELRKKIIKCYKTGTAFVDILMINNHTLKEFEDATEKEELCTKNEMERKNYYRTVKENRDNELVSIKKEQLVPTYKDLFSFIEELLPLLKEASLEPTLEKKAWYQKLIFFKDYLPTAFLKEAEVD